MNKRMIALSCALLLIFSGYIALMTAFEGPVRVENPECIILDTQEQSVRLPWYLKLIAAHDYTWAADGYSRFSYSLPDLFESAEMHVVVSWTQASCVLYIGESRAMEIIDADFPHIIWK